MSGGGRKVTAGLSLTCRMLGLTLLISFMVWLLADYIVKTSVQDTFTHRLETVLGEKSLDYRRSFRTYVYAHNQTAKIIVARKDFIDFVETSGWNDKAQAVNIVYYLRPPVWLMRYSVLRELAVPRYALLFDSHGRLREVFQSGPEGPPSELREPSARLIELALEESYVTSIGGLPMLVATSAYTDAGGNRKALLMLASPMDERFLRLSQKEFTKGLIVALALDETGSQTVLASSEENVVRPGAAVETLGSRYLVNGQEFFEYGSSEMPVRFFSLIPRYEVRSNIEDVVSAARTQQLLLAGVFVGLFTLILFSITRRVRGLATDVMEFTSQELSVSAEAETGQKTTPRGDELVLLKDRFELLKSKVLESQGCIRAEGEKRLKLQKVNLELMEREKRLSLLQSVTEALEVGVITESADGPQPASRPMEEFIKASGPIGRFDLEPSAEEERTLQSPGGRERTYRISSRIIDNKKVVLVRDVTVIKAAEREKRKLISTLDAVVRHIPEGLALIDHEGVIALANPVGVEHLGALAGLSIGGDFKTVSGKRLQDLLVSPPHVVWHELRSGERVFEAAARRIGHNGGEGTVLVLRDVTEARELEKRVRLSERLASLGQMAAGIAHDFNNILTIILGAAELAEESPSIDDSTREHLGIITQSGQRAAGLIHQILDFGRVSPGRHELVDLVELTGAFLKFIRRTFPEGITVDFSPRKNSYYIMADPVRIEQVLSNLAVNARDAMTGYGGRLTITLSDAEAPDSEGLAGSDKYVSIEFADTGPGISPEALPRIFEPFFTTREDSGGTGLGLAQVYAIMKQHGGSVSVRSSGKGTIFTCLLPLVEKGASEPDASAGAEPAPAGKGRTVLLAEDESALRVLVQELLLRLGYEVLAASSGDEALRLARSRKSGIVLVITDIVMPGMDGVELVRELIKLHPDIKVIATSGYAVDDRFEQLRRLGVGLTIEKPFKLSRLSAAITEVLGE